MDPSRLAREPRPPGTEVYVRLARPPGMPPPPKSLASHADPRPGCWESRSPGRPFPVASVSSLHSEGVRRRGPHRTPGSLPRPRHCLGTSGDVTRHSGLSLGPGEPWRLMGKLRLLTVLQCGAPPAGEAAPRPRLRAAPGKDCPDRPRRVPIAASSPASGRVSTGGRGGGKGPEPPAWGCPCALQPGTRSSCVPAAARPRPPANKL